MPIWMQFVTSLLIGGGAGVLAPVVTWRLTRSDKVYDNRVAMMKRWREGLHAWEAARRDEGRIAHTGASSPLFAREPWYGEVRRYLSTKALEQFEREIEPATMSIRLGDGSSHPRRPEAQLMQSELDRIATDWKVA